MAEAATHSPPPAGRDNPFAQDVAERLPPPSSLVIFGATGDLAARKLLPALHNLFVEGLLPERFRLVGVAVDEGPEEFRRHARESIESFSRTPLEPKAWEALSRRLEFLRGDFTDPGLFRELAQVLRDGDERVGATQRLFYLAVAPRFFGALAGSLAEVGLGAGADPPTRLLIEKPFGHDLESGLELNRDVAAAFEERQVFRIDHYLGKETVQNIQVLRFANGILEPVWNRRYVEHVQISVAEQLGIGHRAGYYDSAGALRDVVQNHMLQLVAQVAMEPPARFEAGAIRDEKVKVMRSIRIYEPGEAADYAVRGQYGPGWIEGEAVPGYREEEGVPAGSTTETYVALRLEIDNWRWAGTPFYVRTGKRLPRRLTEIAVRFRPVPHLPFDRTESVGDVDPNELVISVQPEEGASLRMVAKVPGPTMSVRPVQMDFQYGETFLAESPEAYERLLHDALLGDATLFTRSDEVEAEWRIVDPLLEAWSAGEPEPYAAGDQGPPGADRLLAVRGRRWRRL